MLAFPSCFLFSLLVFRSVVAALLPVAGRATTILLTFAWLRLVNEVEPMSVFAINLITGSGSASRSTTRCSSSRASARSWPTGVGPPRRCAGRCAPPAGPCCSARSRSRPPWRSLIVFPLRFLYSMGAGGVLVALTAALVSLTLLPALLAVLGPRVNALGLKRWQVAMDRDAAHVQAGWLVPLLAGRDAPPGRRSRFAAALLIVLGLPFLRIEFTGVDASVLPTERSARWSTTRSTRVPARPPSRRSRGRGRRRAPAPSQDYARRWRR